MLNLSLCIIIKDEIELLKRCVDSAKNIVNEIIVVDTGSTDGSYQLAVDLGCKVYNFNWAYDFSLARNFSVEKANNDWILILDADEYITSIDIKEVENFLSYKNQYTIGEIKIKNLYDDNGYEYDIFNLSRLFNKNNFKFECSIHEYLTPISNIEKKYKLLPIEVCHTGYTKDRYISKNKLDRNMELILKELEKEKDYYLVMHLAKSYMLSKDYENAIIHFEDVLNNKDCYKYTYYLEAVIEYLKSLLNANKFEKALECEKYWDRCNKNDNYIYFMAHAFMKNGFFEKAMDLFISIINKKEPTIGKKNCYYSLAQMFEALGFKKESIEYYELCDDFQNSHLKVKELKNMNL